MQFLTALKCTPCGCVVQNPIGGCRYFRGPKGTNIGILYRQLQEKTEEVNDENLCVVGDPAEIRNENPFHAPLLQG
jgi:hypothetical protein